MDEFVQNYVLSLMTFYYTQYSTAFKYYRAEKEKEISDLLKEIKESNLDQNHLQKCRNQLQKMKEDYKIHFDENKANLAEIKKRATYLRNYFQDTENNKLKTIEGIFQTFMFEYLYKFEKIHTISYMGNYSDMAVILNQLELSKFKMFKEITAELSQNKTTKALKWCQINRSALKKNKLNFEYKLLANKIIEFLGMQRDDKFILDFIQKELASSTSDLEELYFCLKLILERPKIMKVPYDLSWEAILKDFYKIFFEIEGFDRNYFFENILQVS